MAGIKLIDFGHDVEYIDIDTAKVPYYFTIRLAGKTYQLLMKYNEVGGFYTMDLLVPSTGEVLAVGDPVRYGRQMFSSIEDERFPQPAIVPACYEQQGVSEVTKENFGKEVKLFLYPRSVTSELME